MKKLLIIALLPFLVAFQCEDDIDTSGFETSFLIQNNTGVDLFFLDEGNSFLEIKSQSNLFIGSTLNSETIPITPSESTIFNTIRLFTNGTNDFILVYEQSPIDDNLWALNEPSINRYEYQLIITEDSIN